MIDALSIFLVGFYFGTTVSCVVVVYYSGDPFESSAFDEIVVSVMTGIVLPFVVAVAILMNSKDRFVSGLWRLRDWMHW